MITKKDWVRAIIMAALIAGGFLFMSTRSTLWDRDEPRFARATVEMVESGDYMVPTFNGRFRPDKPAGIYWLMSVPVRMFGHNAFAARFVSCLATAAASLVIFFIAGRWIGKAAGYWSMVCYATCMMLVYIGSAATADPAMVFFMLCAMAAFLSALQTRPGVVHWIVMSLGFGAALLIKGPVALLSGLIMGVTLFFVRKSYAHTGRLLVWVATSMLVGAGLFLLWAIPANLATEGEFARQGLGYHVWERMTRPLESHGGSFVLSLPYYFAAAVFAFFPWVVFVPSAIAMVRNRDLGARHFRAVYFSWVLTVLIVMTLVMTKLPHYIFFAFPALAMGAGGVIQVWHNDPERMATYRKSFRTGIVLFGIVAGLMIAAFAGIGLAGEGIEPQLAEMIGKLGPGLLTAAGILALTAVAVICMLLKRRVQSAAVVTAAGMIAFLGAFLGGVQPVVEQYKLSPYIAQEVRKTISPQTPVAMYKYGEPSLVFYMDRRVEPIDRPQELIDYVQQPGGAVVILPEEALETIQEEHSLPGYGIIASHRGMNISNGDYLTLRAIRVYGADE